MYAKVLFIFILFSLNSAMTESEASEHAKFSDEYHRILRQTLSETSQVFESLTYDIKDGKFNMSWSHHKKVPTLKFDFDVIVDNKQTCHLSFELDSHLSHVPEMMKQNDNNHLVQEIRNCAEQILGDNQSTTSNLTQEVLSDFENHLDESISEDSRRSVESILQNKLDQESQRDNLELVSDTESQEESDPKNKLQQFLKDYKDSSEDRLERDALNAPIPTLKRKQGYYGSVKTCTPHLKEVIKTHIRNLVFQNLVQDIKVFDENIRDCDYKNETNQHVYDSILQFNRERCYLRTKLTKGTIEIMTNQYQENNEEMQNCVERFATIELLTK